MILFILEIYNNYASVILRFFHNMFYFRVVREATSKIHMYVFFPPFALFTGLLDNLAEWDHASNCWKRVEVSPEP